MKELKDWLQDKDFMALPDPDKQRFLNDQDIGGFRGLSPETQAQFVRDLPKLQASTQSPISRLLRGAASELLPLPFNPPLSPEAQASSDATMSAAKALPGGASIVARLLEGSLNNIVGQAQSGNWAGAAGAVMADVGTAGLPALLKLGKVGIINRMASGLERSAATDYGKVLGAGKEVPKAIAETKVIPEAIKRGVWAGRFENLQARVADEVERSAQALEKEWAALPKGSRVQATPIWQEMRDRIANTYIKDTRIVENPALKQQYEGLIDKLNGIVKEQTMGQKVYDISAESARSWRQFMDEFIASKPGKWAIDKPLAAEAEAKKIATNAIRNQLAKEYPQIAALNKEFTFWRNFQEILDATATRRVGQEGSFTRKLVMGMGAAAGIPAGPASMVIDAAVLGALDKTFRSTGWRTVKAITKDRLAKAIMSNDAGTINLILKEITVGAAQKATGSTQPKPTP